MARFRIGGSGPDGRGLGCIAGITRRRFDKAGEICKTDASGEVQKLRQCPYVEEVADEAASISVGCGALESPSRRGDRVTKRVYFRMVSEYARKLRQSRLAPKCRCTKG